MQPSLLSLIMLATAVAAIPLPQSITSKLAPIEDPVLVPTVEGLNGAIITPLAGSDPGPGGIHIKSRRQSITSPVEPIENPVLVPAVEASNSAVVTPFFGAEPGPAGIHD